MTIIYLIGVICTFLYNRIMTVISQGVLKKIRDEKNKNVAARKFTPTAALIYDSPVY